MSNNEVLTVEEERYRLPKTRDVRRSFCRMRIRIKGRNIMSDLTSSALPIEAVCASWRKND